MTQKISAETIRGNQEVNLSGMAEQARMQISAQAMEVQRAEQAVQQLEMQLREAQMKREQKEKAEQKGKETKEKINEVAA